jgi:hypothetical protein
MTLNGAKKEGKSTYICLLNNLDNSENDIGKINYCIY